MGLVCSILILMIFILPLLTVRPIPADVDARCAVIAYIWPGHHPSRDHPVVPTMSINAIPLSLHRRSPLYHQNEKYSKRWEQMLRTAVLALRCSNSCSLRRTFPSECNLLTLLTPLPALKPTGNNPWHFFQNYFKNRAALLPHSKKLPSSIPSGRSLSYWGHVFLHVRPMLVWVPSGYSSLLPPSKDMQFVGIG